MDTYTFIPIPDDIYTPEKYRAIIEELKQPPSKPVSTPFEEGATKVKCISFPKEKEDLIVRTKYSIRNLPQILRMTHGRPILPSDVVDRLKPVYFTYLIDDYGLVLGRITNSLEWGTAHQMLVEAEKYHVYIAGEMRIDPDGQLQYNFLSGTYSEQLKLQKKENAALKEKLIRLVGQVCCMYATDGTPLTSVQFIDAVSEKDALFPHVFPSPEEIAAICTGYNDPANREPMEERSSVFRMPAPQRCSSKTQTLREIIADESTNLCRMDRDGDLGRSVGAASAEPTVPREKSLVKRRAVDVTEEQAKPAQNPVLKQERKPLPSLADRLPPIDKTDEFGGVIARATEYYKNKTHPYVFTALYSTRNKKWYWNKNPENPSFFEAAEGRRKKRSIRQRR